MDRETGIDAERLLGLKQVFLFCFATRGWCEHPPCPAQQVTQFSRMLSSGWKLAESSSPRATCAPSQGLAWGAIWTASERLRSRCLGSAGAPTAPHASQVVWCACLTAQVKQALGAKRGGCLFAHGGIPAPVAVWRIVGTP